MYRGFGRRQARYKAKSNFLYRKIALIITLVQIGQSLEFEIVGRRCYSLPVHLATMTPVTLLQSVLKPSIDFGSRRSERIDQVEFKVYDQSTFLRGGNHKHVNVFRSFLPKRGTNVAASLCELARSTCAAPSFKIFLGWLATPSRSFFAALYDDGII